MESHFADSKFYMKSEDASEAISSEVPLVKTAKGIEQPVSTIKNDSGVNTLPNQGSVKLTGPGKLKKAKNKTVSSYPEKLQTPPVLRYVPLSQRKKGESSFTPSPKNLVAEDVEVLKEKFVRLLTKIAKAKRLEKDKTLPVLLNKRT